MEICAGNGNVSILTRENLNLAVPHVARQTSDAGKLQRFAVKRVSGIGHGNFTFAFLCHQRGIALGGVSPRRAVPSTARRDDGGRTPPPPDRRPACV